MGRDRGRYDYYNPDSEKHQEVVTQVKNQLQRRERFEDKKLAKEIHPIFEEKYDWSLQHLRNVMRGARKWMKEHDFITVKEDPRGGIPAIIWKAGEKIEAKNQNV